MDFEINFYQGLLRQDPADLEVLKLLAEDYTRIGEYKKGLELDLEITSQSMDDPVAFYNLACSYSLMDQHDAAFTALDKAVTLGYHDIQHIKKDPDLQNLKSDSRFALLLEKAAKLRSSAR